MITCQLCKHTFKTPTEGMKKFATIVDGKRVIEECHFCPPLDQRKPIPEERPVYKDAPTTKGSCGTGSCGGDCDGE